MKKKTHSKTDEPILSTKIYKTKSGFVETSLVLNVLNKVVPRSSSGIITKDKVLLAVKASEVLEANDDFTAIRRFCFSLRLKQNGNLSAIDYGEIYNEIAFCEEKITTDDVTAQEVAILGASTSSFPGHDQQVLHGGALSEDESIVDHDSPQTTTDGKAKAPRPRRRMEKRKLHKGWRSDCGTFAIKRRCSYGCDLVFLEHDAESQVPGRDMMGAEKAEITSSTPDFISCHETAAHIEKLYEVIWCELRELRYQPLHVWLENWPRLKSRLRSMIGCKNKWKHFRSQNILESLFVNTPECFEDEDTNLNIIFFSRELSFDRIDVCLHFWSDFLNWRDNFIWQTMLL